MARRLTNPTGDGRTPENEDEEDPLVTAATGGSLPDPVLAGADAAVAPDVVGTDGDGNKHENTYGDNAPRTDPTLQAVDNLIEFAKERDAASLAAIEEFIGTSIPKLEALAAKADAGDYAALSALTHAYGNFEQLAPPQMVEAAKTSQQDLDRQLSAYDQQGDVAQRYKALSGQEMTAQERYLLELNRREEEGSRRAAMQAQLSDLGARGARSGGAEMAALLGSQQMTSQNRALQDLGAQAQVNDRAFRGLEGYGRATDSMANTAGQIRDSSDVMSRFNQQQAQQWAQWESNYKADQQEQAVGRTRDLFDANTRNNAAAYERGSDVAGFERDATAMKTGQYNAGGSQISDAIKTGIGIEEGRRAENALKPKKRSAWEQVLDPADIFSLDL